LFARQGRVSEALQFYLEAEAKLEAKGNRETLTAVRLALGDIFFREKMYGSARRYYDQVLKSTPDDFTTLEKAADASLYNLQFDSADSIYQKLTITCRESYNLPCQTRIYQKLAAAYDQDGNPGKSLYYYLRIKDIIEQSGTRQSCNASSLIATTTRFCSPISVLHSITPDKPGRASNTC
jgi:tetratricopeptide (TPR) repeat protein